MSYKSRLETPLPKLQRYVLAKFPDGILLKKGPVPYWQVRCPRCQNAKCHAFINLEVGSGICWDCAWKHGNWVDLITDLEHVGNVGRIDELFSRQPFFAAMTYGPVGLQTLRKKLMQPKLPVEFIPISPETEKHPAVNFLKELHIPFKTAVELGIGFCEKGRYAGRLIIPVVNDGVLEWFHDTAYGDSGGPPQFFPGTPFEEWPFPITGVILGYDKAEKAEKLGITGNPLDWLFFRENNKRQKDSAIVSTIASTVSDAQVFKLLQLTSVKRYVMLFPTAERTAYQLADKLSLWGKEVVFELEAEDLVWSGSMKQQGIQKGYFTIRENTPNLAAL